MAQDPPVTQTMKISDVRSQLNTLVNEVYRKETRVIVEKSGIPVAGIVSAEDLRRLDRLDSLDNEARNVVEAMRAPFRGVATEEIEQAAERAIAESRTAYLAEPSEKKD